MKNLDEAIQFHEEMGKLQEEREKIFLKYEQSAEADKCSNSADNHNQLAEWLRTLKDVKTAIRDGNKLLDQDGCDHEMAFDIYSDTYNKIEKIIAEVKADADSN